MILQHIDLRVGKVIGAENVKKSDNLLKLMVDIGEKQITGCCRSC